MALILVSALMALGREYMIRRDLRYAEAIARQPRVSGDSAFRASAAYHGALAAEAARERWTMLGHGTLGVAGVIIGLGILVLDRRRQ